MNEIRHKGNALAAKFIFSSFPKGDTKEDNFLHVQAPPWPVVKICARIKITKGPEKGFGELVSSD